MKRMWSGLICVMLLGMMVFMAGCGGDSADTDSEDRAADVAKVTCENGVMLGKTEEGVTSFLGVPYAKPPVGDLRWKAPEAPDPGDEEIECFEFGYTALQYEWPSEPASSSEYPKNEDCLTLNIWESKGSTGPGEAKPVMVFFHGGAYGWGGTTDPGYNGHNFVRDNGDVILVTCNYRLGLMGWADFSQIEGGEEYTDINLGLRDHIAALQWIQKNIVAFGGDPDNVTIFGESAGGWSTTALTISPKAKGLFRRVIAESGGFPTKDRKAAKDFANYILEASGAKNMDDLLAISGEEWMELDRTRWIADECCGVVYDGDIIPLEKDMDKAIADAAKRVEMIVGTTLSEWNYFKEDSAGETEDEKFASWVESMEAMYSEAYEGTDARGKKALEDLIAYEEEKVPEEYRTPEKVKAALARSGFVSESWRYEILDFADRFADAGGRIYNYLWEVPSTQDTMYKSAVHAVELPYVFNNLDDTVVAGDVDRPTAEKTQEAWTNFAETGDPSIEEAGWRPYDSKDRQTMVVKKDKWECVSDPSKTPRQLLEIAYGDTPYHVW